MGKINVNQSFDPLYSDSDNKIKADGREIISISNNDMDKILGSNLLFPRRSIEWYTKFNRYGYLDPFNNRTANREYLFFTKPDLNIFCDSNENDNYNDYELTRSNLNPGAYGTEDGGLQGVPLFQDAVSRYKNCLVQLESSIKTNGSYDPFMCLLSNRVSSRLDLPGITAESNESASNMYGSSIQYRSSSFKSDNGYDFTLSFNDTKYLEIYMLAKLYDEYCRQEKLGHIRPKKKYIRNRVIDNQFSIYKFIVGADGEHILYFAKLTFSLISASNLDKSYFNSSYLFSIPVPSVLDIKYGLSIYSSNPFFVFSAIIK